MVAETMGCHNAARGESDKVGGGERMRWLVLFASSLSAAGGCNHVVVLMPSYNNIPTVCSSLFKYLILYSNSKRKTKTIEILLST